MVYRGRPSTGCKTCRRRKIKCDERPEGCVKCADKGYQCPGYESPIDRLFQDESAAVQRKAQKAKAKALLAREEREKTEQTQRALVRAQQAIGAPMLFPMIDRGIAFFMQHYAAGMDKPPLTSATYNQHLTTFGFHPVVATVMTALGLAGTANIFMDAHLKREATRWYMDALKMTNKALTRPVEAKSDSILLATMLLSVFEATHNEKSFNGWLEHVSGSASLLQMRGRSQFLTPAGRRMYMQTVGLLAVFCMGKGVELPKYVHEMNQEVSKWEDLREPGNRFFHVHIAVIDFRAHILQYTMTDLTEIVDRALEIDEEVKKIFEDASEDWGYEVMPCDQGTPGVFGQEYHIYPHLAAAQTWNWIRYIRIYIHDILRNALIAGFGATPPIFVGKKYMQLLAESTETLYQMQADIFASMPQYMHDTPKASTTCYQKGAHVWAPTSTKEALATPSTANSPATSPGSTTTEESSSSSASSTSSSKKSNQRQFTSNFLDSNINSMPKFRIPATATEQLPIVRVSGGYSTLWALFIAGTTPIASPETQEYVLHTLGRVSAEFGINQARVFSTALRTKRELERRGISKLAEQLKFDEWDASTYVTADERQRFVLRDAALKGGEYGIVPIYMPRVGPHVEDEIF